MSRLEQLYGNHPSIRRMQKLTGGHASILQQARASSMDFHADYGVEKFLGDPKLLEQADYSSGTSGILNKIFGRTIFPQLNANAPVWASIPKSKRSRGSPYGWRAKTAFASTGKGGQTEGVVPTAVTSTFVEVAPTIKEHATQMRISGMQQDLTEIDDAWGALSEVHADLAMEHGKEIERALTEDIDTAAGVHSESVDRVSASSTNQAAIGWTAGDEDIFGIDRSAQTWANAAQDAAATARALTKALIKGRLTAVQKNGGDTTYIATGFEGWQALTDLFEAQGRVDIALGAVAGGKVNDADIMEGRALNPLVSHVYGRPIVCSDQVETDSNELPRFYFHDISNPDAGDKPRLGIDLVRPTEVYVAGERSTRAPQTISFSGDSVLALTRFELGCRFFAAQGQLRDTTSP